MANYRSSCNNRTALQSSKPEKLYERCDISLGDIDPSVLWNVDETGMSIVVSGGKVVAKMGSKQVYSRTYADKGENNTLVACVSANGASTKPLIIFKGVRLDPSLQNHPEMFGFPNCLVSVSKSG